MFLAIAHSAVMQSAQTSDSAGVVIVRNGNPWTSAQVIVVDSQPRLRLGGRNRDARYTFAFAAGAAGTPAGGVAVALRDIAAVRMFDANGVFERHIGMEGKFQSEGVPALMSGRGDTLIAFVEGRNGVTVMTPGSGVIRSIPPPEPVACCFADGAYLALVPHPLEISGTPRRSVLAIMAIPTGDAVTAPDTIAMTAGSDPNLLIVKRDLQMGGDNASFFRELPMPFGHVVTAAILGAGVAVGDGGSDEFRIYSRDRALLRIVRWTAPRETLSARNIRMYRSQAIVGLRGRDRSLVDLSLRSYPYPQSAPSYRLFQVDAAGRLWLQKYPMPDDTVTTWAVFSEKGEVLGRAHTPSEEEVTWIGSDELMTVSRRRTDDTAVRIYRFRLAGQ